MLHFKNKEYHGSNNISLSTCFYLEVIKHYSKVTSYTVGGTIIILHGESGMENNVAASETTWAGTRG